VTLTDRNLDIPKKPPISYTVPFYHVPPNVKGPYHTAAALGYKGVLLVYYYRAMSDLKEVGGRVRINTEIKYKTGIPIDRPNYCSTVEIRREIYGGCGFFAGGKETTNNRGDVGGDLR